MFLMVYLLSAEYSFYLKRSFFLLVLLLRFSIFTTHRRYHKILSRRESGRHRLFVVICERNWIQVGGFIVGFNVRFWKMHAGEWLVLMLLSAFFRYFWKIRGRYSGAWSAPRKKKYSTEIVLVASLQVSLWRSFNSPISHLYRALIVRHGYLIFIPQFDKNHN